MRKELAKIIAALDNTFCLAFKKGENLVSKKIIEEE